jgi:hypothetical protein
MRPCARAAEIGTRRDMSISGSEGTMSRRYGSDHLSAQSDND